MSPGDLVRLAADVGATGALVAAATADVRTRRIPNWTVVAVAALFAVGSVAAGGDGLGSSLAAAAIALGVTVALYAFKVVGAGDSKLFTAVACFAGLDYLPLLVLATTLTGGAIAAVSLLSRPSRMLALLALRGKGDWGRGVPYGVAIAVGGAVAMWAPIAGVAPAFTLHPQVSVQDIQRAFSGRPAAPKPDSAQR